MNRLMHQINMVTTINNNLFQLRKRVFLALFFFLVFWFSWARQDSLLTNLSVNERDFSLLQFRERFQPIPSLIYQSTLKKYSLGEARYLYSNGDLQHLQNYKKQNGFAFHTESLSPLSKTGWTLFGALSYLNVRKDDVDANLSYGAQLNGSPIYLFQEVRGFWNHQNYKFRVDAANQITDRLSLGAHLKYSTNLYYRKIDTRNETVLLQVPLRFSASYELNPKNIFSVTLGLEYRKSDLEINNRFMTNNSGAEYIVYLNTGLGSFISGFGNSASFETKGNIPEFQLHWLHKFTNADISVLSQTKFGNEEWLDQSITRTDLNNTLAEYNFTKQKLTVHYSHYFSKSTLAVNLKANYLDGESQFFNEVASQFQNNFYVTSYQVSSEVKLITLDAFINQFGLGVVYENRERLDVNFGYQFDNSYIHPSVTFGFNKTVSQSSSLFSKMVLNYYYPLAINHNPFAANNVYVDLIGNPVANYLETESLGIDAHLGIQYELKDKNLIEFNFIVNYQKALNSPMNSFDNTHFLEIVVGSRLYF